MRRSLVTLLALVGGSSHLLAQTQDPLAQRAAVAAAITGQQPSMPADASSAEIEAALDLPPGLATAIAVSGNAPQFLAPSNLGVIAPRAGNSMLLISTGVAGASSTEPGTGFGTPGPFGNDSASVTLTLQVPASATRLSFEFRFLSAEYPDFVLAGFNDTFVARLQAQTIASQSVDSALFFAGTAANAGGTGFDIVDGSGAPDAGLTDWLSASADVVPGSTVTLTFGIGDFGDSIYDSAVLLDNLAFTNLEVLDGENPAFMAGNDLANDPVRLSTGGDKRIGIAADGTARLLLRLNLTQPGTVQFAIQNPTVTTETGALGAPGAAPQGATINVVSVNTPNGHKAFAVYHAPLEFVRAGSGDALLRSRNLTLTTQFTPQAGGPVQNGQVEIRIERPPVVLCHGLWSSPATWNGFAPLIGDGRFDFERADYSGNNAGRFAVNRFTVRSHSRAAREAKKRNGIASAQVDWIGHSMGGLLPRSFAATGFYRRQDNFGKGDLHKLITVNTPHWGSPFANLLVGIRQTFFVGDLLIVGMERIGKSVVGGAIDDLSEGSPALGAIGATPVRAHAITGTGGSTAIGTADIGLAAAAALSPPPYNSIFRLLQFVSFATTAGIYRFQLHDFIVLLPSQQGGLGGGAVTQFTAVGSHHTAVTSYAPAATSCVGLLNAATTGGSFAGNIPAPNLAPPLTAQAAPPAVLVPAPPGQGVAFPTPGGPIAPGATFTVGLNAFGGYQPASVLFLGSFETFATDDSAPFQATFTVPLEAIGSFSLLAIAVDAQGQVAQATFKRDVVTTATLTGLALFNERVYLTAPGQSQSLSVVGLFSDGVQRVLNGSELGTTYSSNNQSVVQVTEEGQLQAVGEGFAAITITNGGFSVSVLAFVTFEADLSYFGEGCESSVGIPVLGTSGGEPRLGNAGFALTAANAPVQSFLLWLLQAGAPSPTGFPVPGAPACALGYVLPQDLRSVPAAADGTGTTPLPIPNVPALVGAQVSVQLAVLDPALVGLALPIGTSPALQITIGR